MKYTMIKNLDKTFRTFADLKPGDLFTMPHVIGDDKYQVLLKTKHPVHFPANDCGGNAILLENGKPVYVFEDTVVKVYSKSVEFHLSDFN